MDATTQPVRSGAFLEAPPEACFTPEHLTPEDRQMGEATERFMREQVAPQVRLIEHNAPHAMRDLLGDSALLGLLGIDVPEEYGGLGLPKTTSALITEKTALEPSFAVSHAVHTSVGSLPILLFGTESQAQQYLPLLTRGELIGAYALTEPEAGSDALSARTRAERHDQHYLLNGNKIWITNAGFADLFIVFAKVDGERFTAFLVPRSAPGFIVEREEHKLGLHGSSTCRIVLEQVPVPVENRLGEEGQGAYVALYTLNIGRFKIGAAALGIAKEAWRIGYEYAQVRKQFGRPIVEFDLVWRKLARGQVMLFVVESALYRLAGDLERAFAQGYGLPYDARQGAWRAASALFAAECALIKVAATEMLHQIVDDALQIHGGYGFSEEYPIARLYRDTRVNRIYEGTNEINRLNLVERLLYMRRKGLWSPNLTEPQDAESVEGVLTTLRWLAGRAFQSLESLAEPPQVFVEPLADALIALYLLDSAHYRAQRTGQALHRHAVQLFAEWVRRQLSGWWADLEPLVGAPHFIPTPRNTAPLYEAVWGSMV
ncbi:hypothetical protein GBSOP10_10935 [Armatimonadetes bacterium GBS]|jgi:alkylation response protein AidB-like acyl-CoA dehydrogenase|nr:hypothetical protein GBSOP10_10935 [Armatimonadetes bacterium GBS]CUU36784.1 hypothetical protein GXSOP10_1292 [Armatimonadetes bacterium GXS]